MADRPYAAERILKQEGRNRSRAEPGRFVAWGCQTYFHTTASPMPLRFSPKVQTHFVTAVEFRIDTPSLWQAMITLEYLFLKILG
jgi:hypothetical protein